MEERPDGYHENLYLEHLDQIAQEDAAGLKTAQRSYGNSWKSRGGVGAYMMFIRKSDRLQNRVSRLVDHQRPAELQQHSSMLQDAVLRGGPLDEVVLLRISNLMREIAERRAMTGEFDIFAHIFADRRAEGVIDDVRDLRRYLMLIEAECRALGFSATHRDNRPDAG